MDVGAPYLCIYYERNIKEKGNAIFQFEALKSNSSSRWNFFPVVVMYSEGIPYRSEVKREVGTLIQGCRSNNDLTSTLWFHSDTFTCPFML